VTTVAFHVDQLFSPAPGGVGTYVRSLLPALVRQDPSVEVRPFHAKFESTPSAADQALLDGFAVEELPSGIRWLYPRWNLTGRPPLPSPLSDADLVHAASAVAVPPAGDAQKLVVTVHDLAFLAVPSFFPRQWRQVYRTGLRATIRRADAIVTPSRSTAEDLLTRTKVDPSRVHVIPEAAAVPATADENPERVLARLKIPRPYILSVGTLEPRKNLVRLVRAYRRVATTGLPHALVLAGPLGWHRQALMRELALAGPGDIVLTGRVTSADVDALYRMADLFVYPAIYEGFGLPVLEAMARGVPTVCSNTTSLPEVAGDAAIGVHPGSIREIAAGMQRVLDDPQLAERLGQAGRARAGRFTWGEAARLTLQVYEKALGR
jgi:glycosyltransferase involved in cell wall biosynthesis